MGFAFKKEKFIPTGEIRKTLVGGKGRERVGNILEYARKFHHLINGCLASKCHHLYFPGNSEMGQAVCGTDGFHKYFMICLTLLSERTGKEERKKNHQIHAMSERSTWWQDAGVQIKEGGGGETNREEQENSQSLFQPGFRGSV